MTRLMVFSGLLTLALGLTVIGARLAGAIPEPPLGVTLLESGSCQQPCWHGIQPGKTTLREAAEILHSPGSTLPGNLADEFCWDLWADLPGRGCVRKLNPEPDGSIDQIALELPDTVLPLGYLITKFGEPLSARLCLNTNPAGVSTVTAYLYFQGNVEVMAHDPDHPDRLRLDANMSVTQVLYYPYNESWYSPGASNWKIFTWQPSRRNGCS